MRLTGGSLGLNWGYWGSVGVIGAHWDSVKIIWRSVEISGG